MLISTKASIAKQQILLSLEGKGYATYILIKAERNILSLSNVVKAFEDVLGFKFIS